MTKESKANYSGLINFAKSHPELSRTKAITEYRKEGGQAQKKGGLKALAEEFAIQQKEKAYRGKSIRELGIGGHYVPPVKPPRVTKPKVTKLSKKKTKRNMLVLNAKKNVKNGQGGEGIHYIDNTAVAVKTLKKNIKDLYGRTGNSFLQISLRIANDGYTKLNDFSLLLPYHGQLKYDVQELGQNILLNLETYYANLAKKYSNKAMHKVKGDVLVTVKKLNKSLNRFKNITKDKLEFMFAENGIVINSYQVLKIIKTGREEE